jgi:Amt family ammonium transporter
LERRKGVTAFALPFSGIVTALFVLLIFLTPLAAAGLALMNAGLTRSRSAAHTMLASLLIFAVAAIAFLIFGFAWEGFPGRPAHAMLIGGKAWDWIAAEPFFFRGLRLDGSPASLAACLQLFTVGLAALIPLGSATERWRLRALCISSALFAGLTYPLFAHWVWGGGWLAQLGSNYGLGRGFVDPAGAGTIHVVGGLTALALTWILGPRRAKFGAEGMPAAIPGHNAVLVLFGCWLTLLGWLGLNCAGSLLFAGIALDRLPAIAVNTLLTASAAALTTAVTTSVRFSKPDASLIANGWVGGLVAGSASCAFVPPASAIIIGAAAGALVPLVVEVLELRLSTDDPGGAVPAHAVCGIWGLLAVGVFGRFPAPLPGGNSGQLIAQFLGVATLLGFVLPLTYGLNWLVNRFYPQRVPQEAEQHGMDLSELGADAYPEFVTHIEDSWGR